LRTTWGSDSKRAKTNELGQARLVTLTVADGEGLSASCTATAKPTGESDSDESEESDSDESDSEDRTREASLRFAIGELYFERPEDAALGDLISEYECRLLAADEERARRWEELANQQQTLMQECAGRSERLASACRDLETICEQRIGALEAQDSRVTALVARLRALDRMNG
jgi:hypothetical protein